MTRISARGRAQAATLGVVASCFLLCITGTSAAQSDDTQADAFDYAYVPTDPVVAHDIDVALGGVYYF